MALTTNPNVWKVMGVLVVVLTLGFSILFYFNTIFLTFVIGLCMIILTNKLVLYYTKRMSKYSLSRWKRKLYGYVLVFFWIFIILFILGNSVDELNSAIADVNLQNQTLTAAYLSKIGPVIPDEIEKDILSEESIREAEEYVFSFFGVLFSRLTFFIFNGILIIPLMFFMYYKRMGAIKERVFDLVPIRFKKRFPAVIGEIGSQLNDFLSAKVLESTAIGAICCLGFYVSGLKGWLLLGVLAGFLNIVPFIGPVLGAIPPILVGLLDQPLVALYVIITIVIAQVVDNFYLIPFMISGKVKIDPLLSIVLILVGSQLAGAIGMIFALPVFIVYKIVLTNAYGEFVKIFDKN